ncbi:hypothetical protein [Arsukibacterium perlucidum]|uniref:hypothetical protein n=1 Tax=Arsukibacterium perlucidum TaxID=368811 RepID=UPI0009FF0BDA|nr:hypothetical protein [Arsukibacterium perlucidum]
MTEMLAKELQCGLNFLMWPEVVGKAVFESNSLAEFFLNVIRLKPGNEDVTSDHAFFRKIRANDITQEDADAFFRRYGSEAAANAKPIREIGAWTIFKLYADSESALLDESKTNPLRRARLKQFFAFIGYICGVDSAFIRECQSYAPDVNYDFLRRSHLEWLLIDVDLSQNDKVETAKLMIAAMLNFAALLSLYIKCSFIDDNGTSLHKSLVASFLPEIVIKGTVPSFINSNHLLMELLKKAWEKSEHRIDDKCTWQGYYRDLARAEKLDIAWYSNPAAKLPDELKDPEVSKFKKRISRIKSGVLSGKNIKPVLVSVKELQQTFIKAISPEHSTQFDESLLDFAIVKVFEYVQLSLLSDGICESIKKSV